MPFTGTGLSPLPLFAPGLDSLPHLHINSHLHRDWAHSCPHLHRDWAQLSPQLHRDWALAPATSAAGLGPPLPANSPGFQVAAASGLARLPFRTSSIRHRRHGSQRPWQVGQSQAPFALTVPLTGAANESAAADKYGCRCAAVATARAAHAPSAEARPPLLGRVRRWC
jgi:hypothetical protein